MVIVAFRCGLCGFGGRSGRFDSELALSLEGVLLRPDLTGDEDLTEAVTAHLTLNGDKSHRSVGLHRALITADGFLVTEDLDTFTAG